MCHLLKAKKVFTWIKFILKTSLFATLFLPVHAKASTEVIHAHVHGLAELMLVIEKNHLAIQFSSPAINLLGFEHKAISKQDIAKVNHLSKVLNQPEKLFKLTSARCKSLDIDIDTSSLIDSHQKKQQHRHEEHKEHDHDNLQQNDNHSEVFAEYQFKCNNLTHLSSIPLSLFSVFPGIEQIQAMWVTQTKQGAAKLNADNSTLIFR